MTPDAPAIACIISTYNRLPLLKQALASVQKQTFPNWECVVIDDLSTDGTLAWLEELQITDPRFKIGISPLPRARLDLCRYAYNNNVGFDLSTAPLLTYLCDDDLYLPRRFEVMKAKLDRNPEIGAVYGKQSIMVGCKLCKDGIGWTGEFQGFRFPGKILANAAQLVNHSSFMVRREFVDKACGWDFSSAAWAFGDAFFFERLASIGCYLHPIPEILDIFRGFGDGANQDLPRLLKQREDEAKAHPEPPPPEGSEEVVQI